MPGHSHDDQVRRGEALVRRRLELDPRYRNRRTFARERATPGLYRIINDLEKGNRDNYEPQTRAAAEAAYELAPGALDRYFEVGTLEATGRSPLAAVPETEPADGSIHDIVARFLTDDLERVIWGAATMTEGERVGAIEELRAKRAELRAELRATQGENDLGTGLGRQPRLT